MAVALLALKTMNVGQHISTIKGLMGQAKAYAKMGAPSAPGVPDVKGMVKKMLEAEAKKYLEEARVEAIALLVGVMSGALIGAIPELNKIIRVLNGIISAVDATIKSLTYVAKGLFAVIIVLTIVYVVAKIISFIPAVTIGLGAGIAFTAHISVSAEIMNMASAILQDLWPIAFAIIAVMFMILKIYGFLSLVMGIIGAFTQQQSDAKADAQDAVNTSADDFVNSGDDVGVGGDGMGGFGTGGYGGAGTGISDGGDLVFVECTLPSGEVKQMTPEDCLAAGGTFGGMELINELNNLNQQINDLNSMLGACLLPDGTIKMMTPEDCEAAGGCFGCAITPNLCWSGCRHGVDLDGSKQITCQLPDGTNKDITLEECNNANGMDKSVANMLGLLANLKSQRDSLCAELGPLCGFQLDENNITSLMYSDKEVTVEDVTKRTGKRKGFYSNDIK